MQRFTRTREATARARRLRMDSTVIEQRLWSKLRGAQMDGASFHRQHPIGRFVVDFYCAPLKLAIELDGDSHAGREDYDAARTRYLEAKEIRVVRFWNNEVIENLEGVCEALLGEVTVRRREVTPTPTLPLSGGGSVS
jgi:very-short-patch-repair endonuclease